MNKLEDIRKCHVCNGTNLKIILGVLVPDLITDIETIRDVLSCDECETIHYIEEGQINYEFSCKINKPIHYKIDKL